MLRETGCLSLQSRRGLQLKGDLGVQHKKKAPLRWIHAMAPSEAKRLLYCVNRLVSGFLGRVAGSDSSLLGPLRGGLRGIDRSVGGLVGGLLGSLRSGLRGIDGGVAGLVGSLLG